MHAALAAAHEADRQERPESLPDWAKRKRFLRYARRPRCTECRAAFTVERWQAVERTGWDALPPEARPTLCWDCDQRYITDVQQAWPGVKVKRLEQETRLCPSRRPPAGSRTCAAEPGTSPTGAGNPEVTLGEPALVGGEAMGTRTGPRLSVVAGRLRPMNRDEEAARGMVGRMMRPSSWVGAGRGGQSQRDDALTGGGQPQTGAFLQDHVRVLHEFAHGYGGQRFRHDRLAL
ncbi:hypothetical protein [Streptomyces atroolivaceus]|uniref:hypothetical protein n=1 Tax=Streptomyces atroolivaceus TaxID=66869 RepID=UPI00202572AF|nr:hypothetical protein [Streptomyces atroolivaceus]